MGHRIYTIGVYGFDESHFYHALHHAQIDVFFDVRQRRGMRGAKYSFVNSIYLQNKLKEIGIQYSYRKDLAPTTEIREAQKAEDQLNMVNKRERLYLSTSFAKEYESKIISKFNINEFLSILESNSSLVFFCVEQYPQACHRSLLADTLAKALDTTVEHIRP